MSDDDKELKDEGEEEKTGSGKVLDDSILDAFEGETPVEVEDDPLKDPFATEGEDDDEIPLDSGDFDTTADEW
ncbi:MAG: hypothetical protein PHN69_01220 [Candidatus Pacebacteria bacterium]|nr:hypothetical protein [Candidatus Paceibacterota bacterium]